MRILSPRADSNSITNSSGFALCGASSSTNACLRGFLACLRDRVPDHDLGPDHFDHLQTHRLEWHFVKRLEALGFQVQLTPAS